MGPDRIMAAHKLSVKKNQKGRLGVLGAVVVD